MEDHNCRGKAENGKWIFGYYFKHSNVISIFTPTKGSYIVDPKTIGKLVAVVGDNHFYEGDLVSNPKKRIYTVVIWDNLPCLQHMSKGKVFFEPMTNGFLQNKTIIGNIHELEG